MKTLKFFRKPYLAYVMGFMLLFVSCKQYDETNNNSIYHYSKNDVKRLVVNTLPFKKYIKNQNLIINNHNERLNPFEITKNYYLENLQENIFDINKSDQQDILQILNNHSKNNEKVIDDLYSFIENKGFYSQKELNFIYNFRDNLLSNSDFEMNLYNFENSIMNSNEISIKSKNKLMRLSLLFSTLNSLYPDAFNNQYRSFDAWCVASLIGLGLSIFMLAEISIAVAAAEVVTDAMISSVVSNSLGYVVSLVGIGGCFE